MPLNFTNVSDEQVYALAHNKSLSKAFRNKAKDELNSRGKSPETSASLLLTLSQSALNKKSLPIGLKIFLSLFPFFLILQIVVPAIFLPITTTQQWKQFWICKTIAIVLWGVVVILFP